MHIQHVKSNSFEQFFWAKNPTPTYEPPRPLKNRQTCLKARFASYFSKCYDVQFFKNRYLPNGPWNGTRCQSTGIFNSSMFTFLKFSKVADFIGTQMMVEIDAWIEAFYRFVPIRPSTVGSPVRTEEFNGLVYPITGILSGDNFNSVFYLFKIFNLLPNPGTHYLLIYYLKW